ncbi:MAG: N-acetylmuramoyl-L-alanine amidase, partial [Clostridiales bacterium]|nr:N-acetylmuramoyl-L-alanine amidase [Clostridiales bacterium]
KTGGSEIDLFAAADYQAPAGDSHAKVKDFALTETLRGFEYSFSAPECDYLMLYYRNKQESGKMPVYPDENGLFSGEIILPMTYARTLSTVQVQSGKGTVLGEKTVRKGYEMPAAPEGQPGRLTGVTVAIDPGHQENGKPAREPLGPGLEGYTSGTSGMAQGRVTLRKEYIVTMETAVKLRDELLRQGATVVMTRNEPYNALSNLERCAAAEEGGADIMLRLHCDTRADQKKQGLSIYGPRNSDYARAVADPDTYRHMGNLLLIAMKERLGYAMKDSTGMVHINDQFVGNNWAKMICFLVEMGYMSNSEEDIKLATPEYQQMLAEGMAQGVYEIALYRGLVQPDDAE